MCQVTSRICFRLARVDVNLRLLPSTVVYCGGGGGYKILASESLGFCPKEIPRETRKSKGVRGYLQVLSCSRESQGCTSIQVACPPVGDQHMLYWHSLSSILSKILIVHGAYGLKNCPPLLHAQHEPRLLISTCGTGEHKFCPVAQLSTRLSLRPTQRLPRTSTGKSGTA